eukprot:27597-Chlamydomonas_euryale.AAC.8
MERQSARRDNWQPWTWRVTEQLGVAPHGEGQSAVVAWQGSGPGQQRLTRSQWQWRWQGSGPGQQRLTRSQWQWRWQGGGPGQQRLTRPQWQ